MMNHKEELWVAFSAKRAQAIFEAAERREKVYTENPVLLQMDREIAESGARYCAAMVKGGEAMKKEAEALKKLEQKREAFLASLGADLEPRFECSRCQDTGRTEEGLCQCFKRELIARNFRQSNLEQQLEHQSFENFDLSLFGDGARNGLLSPRENMKRIYELARDYTARFDEQTRSLLFVGATGLGKTYLSTAIAKALLEQGKSVVYISAPEFARRLDASRFKDSETELEPFFECDMLILDDFGTESRTGYTMATLTDLMDRRIRCSKPMLFSTNLNLEGIQNAYDERIVSRLLGHFTYCYFYGDDLRRKAFEDQ